MRRMLCLMLLAAGAAGQEFRATVTGRITDSSNAAVPNATVQIKNVETNETTLAVTDSQGDYTAPLLRPGTYTLSVQVAGFKAHTRAGLVLNVGQTAAVNAVLEVGSVTDQVTVTAETPLLETAKSDRGAVIDNEQVREFPLNARNPFMLSMLVAGVNFNGNQIYQRPFDNGAIADWSINGSQNRNNEFLLDGAPNNAQGGGNNIALVPPVDSVQEFKIQTNSYDAQYGHTGGGIINVSLKSGTNTLHGTVYEFARRNGWDANSFQNNARGAERAGHYLDQYGFLLDGPVYLPKLYNGRNRTFFMFNYEGYREGTPGPLNLSAPAPEMLDGDFSKLVDGQGRRIAVYDPVTGRDVNGTWVRDPFAGNAVPRGRINPIARKILDYMPKPNTTTPGAGYAQQNLFVPGGDQIQLDGFFNIVAKVDQNIGAKHRLFFRHANNDRFQERTDNGLKEVPGHQGYYRHRRINYAEVLDWVSTLRPALIVNWRLSFNRFVEANLMKGNEGFDITTLGFPKPLAGQIPHTPHFGVYSFENYIGLGRYPTKNITNNWGLHPTATWIKSGHTIKGGLDMRWIQYITNNFGNPFTLGGARNVTQRDWNRADALSGNSIASWLLGTPSSGSSDYNLFPTFLYRYFAPYLQDDWKVSPRLTINLGLRWDFNIAANERYNRMNRSFDANVVNPVDRQVSHTQFPDLPALKGSLLFAGVNEAPRIAADTYKAAIQPRVGAAYQLSGKLVLRGGWGRYYINPNNDYLQTNGFSTSTPLINSLDGGRTFLPNLVSNPFPDGIQTPPGGSVGAYTFLGRGFNFVNPQFELPYVNQFSAGFQYELLRGVRVEASYVGNRTRKLQTSRPFNNYSLDFRKKCNLMEGGNPVYCDERLNNPFFNLEPFRGTSLYTSPTLARSSYVLPYPHFGGLTEVTRNDGGIWYNALQITVETRQRAGLNLIGTYTLSKMIEQTGFNDVQQNIMQRGLYTWDRPHRLTVGSVYQLPVGKGRRYLNTSHGVWSRLLSGWENTWIFQWQSGRPWDLPGNVVYVKEARLDKIDWPAPRVYAVKPCVARWNDNNTITMQPFSVAYGCTEYNFLITPRFAPRFTSFRDGRTRLHSVPVADVSLNKTTRITESVSVQFRAEGFNVFNTYMFYNANFNNNPESTSFGSVDKATVGFGASNYPRYVQLAVKLIW
ncbi:MAG: TonB-dependent receptor [Acidobacteria bacterium]|nr:TonB-dependent receptor [Acidobacteriota bacterium]